jgi:hypothetical protein
MKTLVLIRGNNMEEINLKYQNLQIEHSEVNIVSHTCYEVGSAHRVSVLVTVNIIMEEDPSLKIVT